MDLNYFRRDLLYGFRYYDILFCGLGDADFDLLRTLNFDLNANWLLPNHVRLPEWPFGTNGRTLLFIRFLRTTTYFDRYAF